jgi:hypothetical protein
MALGLADERCLELGQLAVEPVDGVPHPEAEVGRHLVVPRARGVEPPRGGADQLGEPRLDVEMDVFMLGAEGEAALLDLGADLG